MCVGLGLAKKALASKTKPIAFSFQNVTTAENDTEDIQPQPAAETSASTVNVLQQLDLVDAAVMQVVNFTNDLELRSYFIGVSDEKELELESERIVSQGRYSFAGEFGDTLAVASNAGLHHHPICDLHEDLQAHIKRIAKALG